MRKWVARLFWIAAGVMVAADFMEARWRRQELREAAEWSAAVRKTWLE